jgi:hypothetical protein
VRINVSSDIKEATRGLTDKLQRQVPFAAMKAINSIAKKVRDAERAEIAKVIDRPRPVTLRAVVVEQYASYKGGKFNLEAIVAIDNLERKTASESLADAKSLGQGKNAIPPSKFLIPQVFGGNRVPKRFERALQKADLMPGDKMAVFANRSNALDKHGNLPGPKIVQILSWFKAFKAEGFKSNMTDRTRKNLLSGKRKGLRYGMGYFRGGKGTDLPDGIWERHYPNGPTGKTFIRPILIYVNAPAYKIRFNFFAVARRVIDQDFSKDMQAAIANAVRTARK